MKIGFVLWEFFTIAVIVLGALGLFLLRSWFSRTAGEVDWALWLRFSLVFLAAALIALIEGVLLAPFGFGWFIVALGITLYVLKKALPKLLGQRRYT